MKTRKPFEVKVNSKYGAPLGRPSDSPEILQEGPVKLEKVPFFDGDYDKGGAYWGFGQPLWCAWNDAGAIYFRADSFNDATKHLMTLCVNAQIAKG